MERVRIWPPLLDWKGHGHWGADEPCVICEQLTPLRSDAGKPCHKVCAEDWYEKHPDAWDKHPDAWALYEERPDHG